MTSECGTSSAATHPQPRPQPQPVYALAATEAHNSNTLHITQRHTRTSRSSSAAAATEPGLPGWMGCQRQPCKGERGGEGLGAVRVPANSALNPWSPQHLQGNIPPHLQDTASRAPSAPHTRPQSHSHHSHVHVPPHSTATRSLAHLQAQPPTATPQGHPAKPPHAPLSHTHGCWHPPVAAAHFQVVVFV